LKSPLPARVSRTGSFVNADETAVKNHKRKKVKSDGECVAGGRKRGCRLPCERRSRLGGRGPRDRRTDRGGVVPVRGTRRRASGLIPFWVELETDGRRRGGSRWRRRPEGTLAVGRRRAPTGGPRQVTMGSVGPALRRRSNELSVRGMFAAADGDSSIH
jgi:hypothetical protein